MKRLRIYVWFAAFVFLANAWLCHVFSSREIFSSNPPPIWRNALTHIALISQLPSLPLSRVVADWFDLSYCGWSLATSVISIVIYFPLIHLARPWTLRVSMRSIGRRAALFSSSLNPCVRARKTALKLTDLSAVDTKAETAQAVAKLSSNTLDLPDSSSAAPLTAASSHTLIGS